MPRLGLQLKAQFQNVTGLRPTEDDYTLMVQTKCTSCHETHPKMVGITASDANEMSKGARGSANLVITCAFCKKEGSAKFDDPTPKAPQWTPIDAQNTDWQTLCSLDFRGIEPVNFEPRGHWTCKGTDSNTLFDAVEFEEDGKEWMDYDEKAAQEVSITELEYRWKRI